MPRTRTAVDDDRNPKCRTGDLLFALWKTGTPSLMMQYGTASYSFDLFTSVTGEMHGVVRAAVE